MAVIENLERNLLFILCVSDLVSVSIIFQNNSESGSQVFNVLGNFLFFSKFELAPCTARVASDYSAIFFN